MTGRWSSAVLRKGAAGAALLVIKVQRLMAVLDAVAVLPAGDEMERRPRAHLLEQPHEIEYARNRVPDRRIEKQKNPQHCIRRHRKCPGDDHDRLAGHVLDDPPRPRAWNFQDALEPARKIV